MPTGMRWDYLNKGEHLKILQYILNRYDCVGWKIKPNTNFPEDSCFSIHVYDFQLVSSVQIVFTKFQYAIIFFLSMLRVSVI